MHTSLDQLGFNLKMVGFAPGVFLSSELKVGYFLPGSCILLWRGGERDRVNTMTNYGYMIILGLSLYGHVATSSQ